MSLLKYKKLDWHGGKYVQSQLLRRLRQEDHLNTGGGGCGWSLVVQSQLTATSTSRIHRWDFNHIGQASLKFLASSDQPTSASQSAGITGMSHCTWPDLVLLMKGRVMRCGLLLLYPAAQTSRGADTGRLRGSDPTAVSRGECLPLKPQ
ncbi:Protein GVQW1 [Plecturocebus cupreus]